MLTPIYPTCKKDKCPARQVTALLLLITAFTGCSTVETQSFNVPRERQVESAYIAADADFGKYDRLHAVDMGIFFPKDSYTPPEDIQRIRQIFRTAFLGELQNYTIVDSAGPGAMTVQATLIDFRNSSSGSLMSLQEDLRDLVSNGEILFLMEMRDSQSNAVLARAADSAQTPTLATSEGMATDWTSVEDAARHWAALFRQFLDQNFGR